METNEQHERKWYLAAKVLTNNRLDEQERDEWKSFEADQDFQRQFELMKQHLSKVDALPHDNIDVQRDWQIVWDRIRDHGNNKLRWSLAPALKYAAVITFCVVASFTLGVMFDNFGANEAGHQFTTITAPSGSKTAVTLPDSSTVWLNALSTISFDENFGTGNRSITLEGEAFFDVVKNDVPFMVFADQFTISVLGTAFNVKTYKDDDKMMTTLVRGSLKILHDGREVLLRPNEKVTITRIQGASRGNLVHQKGIDAETEIAWKDGWLSVHGESLSELAKRIERIYNVKIVFRDEELRNFRYTGRLRQLSLEQVLKALSLTSPVAFSIDNNNVTLWENETTKSRYKSLQNP